MSSGGASHAHRAMAAYDAAKGGIEALTRAMALDLAPYGVRVNFVVPGLIRTYDISDELAAERGQVVPLQRLGTADDMAGPIVFLASDDARYMTGTGLVVDGGVLVQQRSAPVDIFPVSGFPVVPEELVTEFARAFAGRHHGVQERGADAVALELAQARRRSCRRGR